jgi:hypothetical protein
MYYNKFIRTLAGNSAVTHIRSFGHLIEKTADAILVDGEKTDFVNLEEARQYIKTQYETKRLEEQVKSELYDDISENKIANIIQEHHNIKVTDTLIESYIDLASSKLFTVDPVVHDIRKLNKLDKLIEGKIDYKLSDGSIVAINEVTQMKLNTLLDNQQEIIEHMRESKENFLNVLKQIGE